jgi:hypothetical protein
MEFSMQQGRDIRMSTQEKLDISERAMGQKNYVHARLLAEQINALTSGKVHLAASALHTGNAAPGKPPLPNNS